MLNWAGNVQYATDTIDEPSSVDEVRRLVKSASRLKALGTRHSFNGVGDSRHRLLVMTRLNRVVALDAARRRVTVEAGITYGALARYLGERGFALHNLASLPHVSVAGACATATHGSGVTNGNLATAVTGLELVTADGSVVSLSADVDREGLNGAVVSLGALGVVTKMTLTIEPAYAVRQDVFEDLPLRRLTERFEAIMGGGYSVSLFTDWQGPRVNQVWVKSRSDGLSVDLERHGARRATRSLHPIAGASPVHCTEQLGVPGPWFERLPHFRMDHTPSSGLELQAEYFVPQARAVEAVLAVADLGPLIGPHLLVSEIRTIAADELWLSPSYRQACVAIHFTWKPDWDAVRPLLTAIEQRLAPLGARPHWGKQFTLGAATIAAAYPKLPAFRQLMTTYDPGGKFVNDFLATYLAAV